MFTIPSGLISTYNEMIDSIIEFNGVPCLLVYPPKLTTCPNCIQDTITKKSTNKYRSGGPYPFTNGNICPFCGGEGYKQEEVTEAINMCVYWTPKSWLNIGVPIDVPDGVIQTKGYLSDLPKIKKAKELRVHSNISAFETFKYARRGEPVLHGFKSDRYILTFWNRLV